MCIIIQDRYSTDNIVTQIASIIKQNARVDKISHRISFQKLLSHSPLRDVNHAQLTVPNMPEMGGCLAHLYLAGQSG